MLTISIKDWKVPEIMKSRNDKIKYILAICFILLLLILNSNYLFSNQIHIGFKPISNHPPDKPINPWPINKSTGKDLSVTLKVFVTDPDADNLNVYFYNAINDQLIGTDIVLSGENATVQWDDLSYNDWYFWYAISNDTILTNISDIWCFKTIKLSPTSSSHKNKKPVANITIQKIGYVNKTLIMHGNYSYDPDGIITGYRWDYNNDGLFDTDWSKNPFTTYIFNKTKEYTIKLQVKDNCWLKETTTEKIDIIELPPEKKAPVAENNGPYYAYINEQIQFENNGSFDSDGNITFWLWNFGDGNISYEKNPVHSYNKAGSYIVTLTIKDNDGLVDQDFTTVNIEKKTEHFSLKELILLLSLILIIIVIIIATLIAFIILKKNIEYKKHQPTLKIGEKNISLGLKSDKISREVDKLLKTKEFDKTIDSKVDRLLEKEKNNKSKNK